MLSIIRTNSATEHINLSKNIYEEMNITVRIVYVSELFKLLRSVPKADNIGRGRNFTATSFVSLTTVGPTH